ncbi:MAG: hypothetical protein AB7U97_27765, partial [Pirellulales bacterium]
DSRIVGLRVAACVFALVCFAQLLRLLVRPEVLVAGHLLPLWPSVLAVIVAGALSVWLWKLSAPTKLV